MRRLRDARLTFEPYSVLCVRYTIALNIHSLSREPFCTKVHVFIELSEYMLYLYFEGLCIGLAYTQVSNDQSTVGSP